MNKDIFHVIACVEVDILAIDAPVNSIFFRRLIALASDTNDHAYAVLKLTDPCAIDRLHKDNRARSLIDSRELARGDEQRVARSRNDSAERSFLQPARKLVTAGVRRVIDLQRRERVSRLLARQA